MTSDSSGVASIVDARPVELPLSVRVDALYRRHHVLVYRLALRYGRGNAAWAEDVTQEVFLCLLGVLERLDEREGLEPWLYRVTTNRCLNRLRRERVREAAPVRWLLGAKTKDPVDPERLAAAREGLDQAWGALDALSPKERVAFCMYHLDGKLLTEIGELIGHSKGYVCKLIKRAETHVRAAGWEVPEHD